MSAAHEALQKVSKKQQQQQPPPTPLTLKQLRDYPESARNPPLPNPLKQGKVQVGASRGQKFGIHYKIYGHGPKRILWLAGHGDRIRSYRRFALYFGQDNSEKFTSLFLENRGIGESEGPWGWWTMKDLAIDAKEVLDSLQWVQPKSVHVVGHSMGGMCAQELCLMCPERIVSMTLISTTSNWLADLSLWSATKSGLAQILPKSEDAKLAEIKATFFGHSWPDEPDEQGIFPTNGDNWAATSYLSQPIPYRGAILQAPACVRHKISQEQLKALSDQIGVSRIQILQGCEDKMVPLSAAEKLRDKLSDSSGNVPQLHTFDDTSHLPPVERFNETRDLIESICASDPE